MYENEVEVVADKRLTDLLKLVAPFRKLAKRNTEGIVTGLRFMTDFG